MAGPSQPFSTQGENIIIAAMVVGLVALLIAGFAVFGAPLPALLAPVPLALFCWTGVRKDLRHVRRHGWNAADGSDGPDGGGGGPRPPEPAPEGPSGGDGEQFDWDAFLAEFRDHVDRQPVDVNVDRQPVA